MGFTCSTMIFDPPFVKGSWDRRKTVDSPFDCCTSTVMIPSGPPRTFSICCLGKFLFLFSYIATLGSQRAPGLYMISSSDSWWKNLQQLCEKVGNIVSWCMCSLFTSRKLDFCTKIYAKQMQKESNLSILFLTIHLVLRRYKIWSRKQWDSHASVSLRIFFNGISWKHENHESGRHITALTQLVSTIIAVVMQEMPKG